MPLAASEQVRVHLDACPVCRTEWQELLALKRVLAAARAPQAPVGFWEQAHRRLRERQAQRHVRPLETRRPWWDLLWQRAPALVAGAAAIVTVVLIPLSAGFDLWDAPAMDTPTALAHHAAYCARLPLTDRRSMDYIVAESRPPVVD